MGQRQRLTSPPLALVICLATVVSSASAPTTTTPRSQLPLSEATLIQLRHLRDLSTAHILGQQEQLSSFWARGSVPRLKWSPDVGVWPALAGVRLPVVLEGSVAATWPLREWTWTELAQRLPASVGFDRSSSPDFTYYGSDIRDRSLRALKEFAADPRASQKSGLLPPAAHTATTETSEAFVSALLGARDATSATTSAQKQRRRKAKKKKKKKKKKRGKGEKTGFGTFVRVGKKLTSLAPELLAFLPGWQSLSFGDRPRILDETLEDVSSSSPPRVLFWSAAANTTSTAHFDSYDNSHAVMHGRKRFLLSPPADTSLFIPFPFSHPMARQAQTGAKRLSASSSSSSPSSWRAAPGSERGRRLWAPESARLLDVTVGPGEVLFVPANWWHAVHHVEGPTVSIGVVADTPEFEYYARMMKAKFGPLPFFGLNRTKDWTRPAVGAALQMLIPALLYHLQPSLSRYYKPQQQQQQESEHGIAAATTGVLGLLTRGLFSSRARRELGVHMGDGIYPCQGSLDPLPSGEERTTVATAVDIMRRRFERMATQQRLAYLLPWLETTIMYMGPDVGIKFLEDCVIPSSDDLPEAPPSAVLAAADARDRAGLGSGSEVGRGGEL